MVTKKKAAERHHNQRQSRLIMIYGLNRFFATYNAVLAAARRADGQAESAEMWSRLARSSREMYQKFGR